MDGYQVASRLRHEPTDPIVIVAIAGSGREEGRRRSREAGIDHHLFKPVDLTASLSLLSPPRVAPCRT
jgi:CheY-like chemotaxis protein